MGSKTSTQRLTPRQNTGSIEVAANSGSRAYDSSIWRSGFSFITAVTMAVMDRLTLDSRRNMKLTLLQREAEYSTIAYCLPISSLDKDA